MKIIITFFLLTFLLITPKTAFSEVKVNGEAEIYDLLVEALLENSADAELDCYKDYNQLGKEILRLPENKKLLKAASNKAVKSFFKLLNLNSLTPIFKEAAVEAAIIFCEGSDDTEEDPIEDDPEF